MSGLQLVARIRHDSKYLSQAPAGRWFDVRIAGGRDHYRVHGNDNAYRLANVEVGVRLDDGTVVDLGKEPGR